MDRILLESDAPDALPKFKSNSVSLVQENTSALQELLRQSENQSSESSDQQNQELNHPANIHSVGFSNFLYIIYYFNSSQCV